MSNSQCYVIVLSYVLVICKIFVIKTDRKDLFYRINKNNPINRINNRKNNRINKKNNKNKVDKT